MDSSIVHFHSGLKDEVAVGQPLVRILDELVRMNEYVRRKV